MPRRQEDEDEDEDYRPDDERMPPRKRHKSLARSTSQEEPSAAYNHAFEAPGNIEVDEAYTAASYRPNPRKSATVAIDRMSKTSQPSRTSRPSRGAEEQQDGRPQAQRAGTGRTSNEHQHVQEHQVTRNRGPSEANRTSRHVHIPQPQQQNHRRAPQSQIASSVPVRPSPLSNMSTPKDFQHPRTELTAASGRPVRVAAVRTVDRMSNQNQAGNSSAALGPVEEDFRSGASGRPARPPISREQQRKQNAIMVLYRNIFDSKLKEFPFLMTFEPIPDTWEEPLPPRTNPGPPGPPTNIAALNLSIPQVSDFDAFHQQSLTSTLRMQTPYGGPYLPVPRGYESYSFQNYPHTGTQSHSPSTDGRNIDLDNYLRFSPDVFGQAVPSLRTTPKYHPTNELTPEQLARYHNDRRLSVKMKAAWVDNEKVRRLRAREGDLKALQTLWDVAQVFRARSPVNESAESVRWFVDTRDEILGLRPRSRSQTQGRTESANAEEEEERDDGEDGQDSLEDQTKAVSETRADNQEEEQGDEEEEEAEPEPEAMDVDEPDPLPEPQQQQHPEYHEEEMSQANNAADDDNDDDINLDELGPEAQDLIRMEQERQLLARQALLQQEEEERRLRGREAIQQLVQERKQQEQQRQQQQHEQEEQQQPPASVSPTSNGKGGLGINDLLN